MAPRSTRINPETPQRGAARSFLQVIDTYYQPSRDTRKEAADQKAFGQVTGLLQQKADQIKKARNESEFTQGTADAMREEAGQELQGIKNGGLFRQNSVYYKAGLNEQKGKVAGQRFRNQAVSDYENWSGKNASDDPAAFEEWFLGVQSIFIEENKNNPELLSSAMPYLNESFNNLGVRHQAYTDSRLQEEHLEAYQTTLTGIWDQIGKDGQYEMQDEDGNIMTDWNAVVADIKQEADDMYGFEGGLANEKMVEAAMMHADTFTDATPLIALARAHDSGQIKLSPTALNRLKRAADQLEQDVASAQAGQTKAQKAARDAAVVTATGNLLVALEENPNLQVYDWMKEAGLDPRDADMFGELVKVQETVGKANDNSAAPDSQGYMGFMLEYMDAETPADKAKAVMRAANAGIIGSSDIKTFMGDVEDMQNGKGVFSTQTVKTERTNYLQSITMAAEQPYFDDGQKGQIAITAQTVFDQYVMDHARGLDMEDPDVARPVIEGATRAANEAVYAVYPLLQNTERLTQEGSEGVMDAVKRSGLRDVIVDDQDAQAAEVQRQMDDLTRGSMTAAEDLAMSMPTTPEGIEEMSEEVFAQAVQDEPPAWEMDEEPSEITGNFYGQLMQKFTDERDDSGSYLATASTVMQDDPEFAGEVQRLATKYSVNPMALLAVMDFETGGTFDVAQKNAAGSGATGLIQFMPKTARSLGTSVEELAGMSRAEQMVYVEKYLDQFAGKIRGQKGVDDIYMAVLWPAAAGKPDGYPIFKSGTIAYEQNKGLDTNGDGTVTKFEAASKVKQKFHGY